VSPPINGSQNSKRRNVGAFNDTPNVEWSKVSCQGRNLKGSSFITHEAKF
jgi:hypothetical protein